MTPEARRAFEMRQRYLAEAVQTATPATRLTMLFDSLELDLAKADKAFAEGRDLKAISDPLIHAQNILFALRETIDTGAWEAAGRLQALYDHLHNELVKANLDKERSRAAEVATHVSRLAAAWREAAGQVAAPVGA